MGIEASFRSEYTTGFGLGFKLESYATSEILSGQSRGLTAEDNYN